MSSGQPAPNPKLKQKLLEALQFSQQSESSPVPSPRHDPEFVELQVMELENAYQVLYEAELADTEAQPEHEPPLEDALAETASRLQQQVEEAASLLSQGLPSEPVAVAAEAATTSRSDPGFEKFLQPNSSVYGKTDNGSIGVQDAGLDQTAELKQPAQQKHKKPVSLRENKAVVSGGSMADLSGYRDLSKAPLSLGNDIDDVPSLDRAPSHGGYDRDRDTHSHFDRPAGGFSPQSFQDSDHDVDTEFSGNVKTLIRLVNELPGDVTKQTGAQIIRLTMEAMGISMEDVLSEAQSAQSEMLDAVRANIKKIEEYKTVIRKLETDIKYYQGKANELSEIIDLFILSNTAGNSSGDSNSY